MERVMVLGLFFTMFAITFLVVITDGGFASAQVMHSSSPLTIFTPKSYFVDGETIPINVTSSSNLPVRVFLTDSGGNIENSTEILTDNTGKATTTLGIPSGVIGGGWYLLATSENGFATLEVMVNVHGISTMSIFPAMISPLKQAELGIPAEQVQCKEGLVIAIKASNGDPACVKPETFAKLQDLGWVARGNSFECEKSPWNCSGEIPEGTIDNDKTNSTMIIDGNSFYYYVINETMNSALGEGKKLTFMM